MKNWWWSGFFATMFFMIFGFANALVGVSLQEILIHVAPASIVFFLWCWLILHMYDLKRKQQLEKGKDENV